MRYLESPCNSEEKSEYDSDALMVIHANTVAKAKGPAPSLALTYRKTPAPIVKNTADIMAGYKVQIQAA
jgi:hypothetical protein